MKNLQIMILIIVTLASSSLQAMHPNTWTAAQTGDLKNLQYWVQQGKFDNPSQGGLTPLFMAAFASRDKVPNDETYFEAIKLLVDAGANIAAREPQYGQSILHKIAQRGDLKALNYVLPNPAVRAFINLPAGKELRTPLADAVRAHQGSLVWLDIDTKDLDQGQFNAALDQALQDLNKKVQQRLTTAKLIEIIRTLIKYGALPNIADKEGHSPAYYINSQLIIPEADRVALLQALGQPTVQALKLAYSMGDEKQAIEILKNLAGRYPQAASKLRMAQYALEAIARSSQPLDRVNILRVARSLVAKANELLGSDQPTALVTTIIHDTALGYLNAAQQGGQVRPLAPAPVAQRTAQPTTQPSAQAAAQASTIFQPAAYASTPTRPSETQVSQYGRPVNVVLTNGSNDIITLDVDNKYEQERWKDINLQPGESTAQTLYPSYDKIALYTGRMVGNKPRPEWMMSQIENQVGLYELHSAKSVSTPYSNKTIIMVLGGHDVRMRSI